MGKIEKLKAKLQELNNEIETIDSNIKSLKNDTIFTIQTKVSDCISKIEQTENNIRTISKESLNDDKQQPFFINAEEWYNVKPILDLQSNILPDKILIGKWVDYDTKNSDSHNITIPAYIPFFGKQKAIIINVTNNTEEKGLSLLRAIIERIHSMMPHFVKFSLIDPVTNGAAFPMQRDVQTRQQDSDIYHLLDDIIADSTQITSTGAYTKDDYFTSRGNNSFLNDKLEIICVANFPCKSAYDSRTIDKIINIGNIGYVSGKYLFIVNNTDKANELPNDFSFNQFDDPIIIDIDPPTIYSANIRNWIASGAALVIEPENECNAQTWNGITEQLKQFKPKERKITWEKYIDVTEEYTWTGSSEEILETTIGDANGQLMNIWFGKKDGKICAHGMLAATTGAGKSNFYHALILGLAKRYSPEELRMYLIDGKNGVEFEVYKSFPHAEVVSLKSSAELAGSVLTELVDETKRRNELFRKNGVNNFEEYRKNQANKLPRILLLIDEYQVLFEGDNSLAASNNLYTLSAQARSAGIHILLGSQHFGAPNMMQKDLIFANIQIYIAMKMTMDDRLSLTMFGKDGKELIKKCEMPGQIVINDNGGTDGANRLGKVAYIGNEDKKNIISDITERAIKQGLNDKVLRTIVFEGDSAPNMDANNQLLNCLEKTVLSPNDLQTIARLPENKGGFGKIDWIQSEKPIICWMGQELNVYGQSSFVMKRRNMENVIITGDKNPYRYGMLLSCIFSLIATNKPNDISFYIFDRSAIGTDWNPYLNKVANEVLVPAGYETCFENKVKNIKTKLEEIAELLKKRLELDQDERTELKPIVIVLTEPENIEDLNLAIDKNGFRENSILGNTLEYIYTNGAAAGIHVIISSAGVISLLNVLQKKQLVNFRHRVSLQISEQESFDLFGTRSGSSLQKHGEEPVLAQYKDNNGSEQIKFKPYSVTDVEFDKQFEHLKSLVLKR